VLVPAGPAFVATTEPTPKSLTNNTGPMDARHSVDAWTCTLLAAECELSVVGSSCGASPGGADAVARAVSLDAVAPPASFGASAGTIGSGRTFGILELQPIARQATSKQADKGPRGSRAGRSQARSCPDEAAQCHGA